ncbi:hypothetical protein ACFOU0_02825 [Salinicoccus sesuvii]|uniref:HNH nuclease domain-containing protein n=1 Tax=Salinicoccus sesuvii TaxID=868281 RepID=A0ABV7N5N4_9STAP
MKNYKSFKSLFEQSLETEYPDKIIKSLNPESELFRRIKTYCGYYDLDYKTELKKLGFQLYRKGTILESEIPTLLYEHFPKGNIDGLESIKEHSSSLNNYINKYCKERGITKKEYIRLLGFKITKVYKPKYNFVAIKELRDNYDFSLANHALIFGVSRQLFEKKKIDNASSNSKLLVEVLKKDHEKIVCEMLKSYNETYTDDNGLYLQIYKHNTESKIAILVKEQESVHYVFNLSEKIEREIKRHKYCALNKKDDYHLNQIRIIMNKYRQENSKVILESGEYRHFRLISEKLGLTIDGLLNKLGFYKKVEFKDKRNKDETEIIETLRKFLLDDGITVSLPSYDNSAQSIRQFASRRNMSTEEFVKSYNFQYSRGVREIQHSIIEEIKEKYIVKGNAVYISSYDRFYSNIVARANKQGQTLDQFLYSLGFERLSLEQLPKDYKPYDWIQDIKEFDSTYDFINEINSKYLYDGEVYLPSRHYFYDKLFYYSLTQNNTINKQLEEWGFIRTYKRPKEFMLDVEESDISPIKLKLINDIKGIQKDIEIKSSSRDIVNRSNQLIKKLKELYNYNCQICESDNDGILMENGHKYIEVHHINPIHNAKAHENEEDLEFDNYRNLICLCPFHHKYVHYHMGGDYKLSEDKKELINPKREKLLIVTDFHLY